MSRRPSLVILACALGSLPARAQGGDDLRAKTLYQAGVVYYEQADYQRALDSFQEAFRISARPALLYNIAQSYDRLGKLDETIEYAGRYVAAAPDAPDRGAVESWLRALEARRDERDEKAAPPALAPLPAPTPTEAPPAFDAPEVSTERPGPPWHRRWYVWAGAGAIVVGAVVAAIVLSAGDNDGVGAQGGGVAGDPRLEVPYP